MYHLDILLNYMKQKSNDKTRVWVMMLLMLFPISLVKASQSSSSDSEENKGWYVGLEGGPAFGVSTLSSFAADKTRCGFTAGLFGGYQFNHLLSVEIAAKWGKLPMAARQCCVDADNWLSVSGNRYVAEVLGEQGEYMSLLKGNACYHNYALRFHLNVLGFVPSLKDSPWRVEVSPQVSIWSSHDKMEYLATKADFQEFKADDLYLGYGANLQASYQFRSGLSLGIFSGITFLNGARLDGLEKTLHKNNFVWESGMRLGWRFHHQKKQRR